MAYRLAALHNSSVGARKSNIYDDRDNAGERYLRTADSENGQRSSESNDMKEVLNKMGTVYKVITLNNAEKLKH